MKKIFVVAGELSGDRTAAWYINKIKPEHGTIHFEGVGGDFLASTGAVLFERFEQLNVTGLFEIITQLPRLLRIMNNIVNRVIEQQFDEVILVDFPGFNLRLAAKLKQRLPNIKITYVAPPQLWCWGAWRVKKIRMFFNDVVVLYPFEVAWYKQHGVTAQWIGCPTYDAVEQYINLAATKKPVVALMPGSRLSEIERLLPLITDVAKQLHHKYPHLSFVMPLAQSLPTNLVENSIQKNGLLPADFPLALVRAEDEKYKVLGECCLAITKPGTVTLELALLGVPALVFFKISSSTYWLARCLAHVAYMALPNLLLGKTVYPEFIQQRCTPYEIMREADNLLASYFGDNVLYNERVASLDPLRKMLSVKTR